MRSLFVICCLAFVLCACNGLRVASALVTGQSGLPQISKLIRVLGYAQVTVTP